MMYLTIEVPDEDGASILEWYNTPHRVFITSSVPALHAWRIHSLQEVNEMDSRTDQAREYAYYCGYHDSSNGLEPNPSGDYPDDYERGYSDGAV